MICRLCERDSVELLIDFGMHPIVHGYIKTLDEKYTRYPFRLGHCKVCDFIQLMDSISPDVLYQNYFTVSGWKNQPHIPRLINVIQSISGLDLKHSILDIGCNDGSFLAAMRDAGYMNIYGIEPTKDASEQALAKDLNIHCGFFGENIALDVYGKNRFDIITTRQVLEHINSLDDFMKGINSILKNDGCLVIEIPDTDWAFEYFDYALWEEHVNYFTLNTLKNLMRKYSFEIIHHETTLFSGKALTIFCEKKKTSKTTTNFDKLDEEKILKYKDTWPNYKDKLNQFLRERNSPVAMYGCGARSSNFINFTGISSIVDCFIDDQPEKQNLIIPGCELKINSWDDEYFKNHLILLGVNTENEHKVINKRNLNKEKSYSVLPPSRYLPSFWKHMIYG